MITSIFLVWMQGHLIEECILIIPLAWHFSHISFLLPFVKSSKEVLGIGFGLPMWCLYITSIPLVMTKFAQLPVSIFWLVYNKCLISLQLPPQVCSNSEGDLFIFFLGMWGIPALGFKSFSLLTNSILTDSPWFQKKACAMVLSPLLLQGAAC